MKIHIGDNIVVISGKDKGKQGTVLRVLPSQNRVVVEGINMRVRHIKKTQNQAGQRVSYEASLHASNVMILDPKSKKPTRIGYKVDPKTGKKSRIALASGEVITKSAATKTTKTTKKADKKDEAKADSKTSDKAPAAPAKTPFWKRGAKGDKGDTGSGSSGSDGGANVIQTAHRAQGG
jgi:large subunit ribosomal protein L24